jgi:phosphonate transport system permease protein
MSTEIRGAPGFRPGRRRALVHLWRLLAILGGLLVLAQAMIVVQVKPEDLITGIHGMADIIRRAVPPDFSLFRTTLWPALETIDIALFGTVMGIIIALPLAMLAAVNTTPARPLYWAARGVIGFARAVPDLVWALFFVTAVGLGPFPGASPSGCIRSACSAACSPKPLRIWTWRRSTPWR